MMFRIAAQVHRCRCKMPLTTVRQLQGATIVSTIQHYFFYLFLVSVLMRHFPLMTYSDDHKHHNSFYGHTIFR